MRSKQASLKAVVCGTAALVMLAGGASAQAQTTLFLEDFGTGSSRSTTPNPNVPPGFGFLATGAIADDHYAIVGNGALPDPATSWTEKIGGDADDNRVMVVNAGTTEASMYRRGFTASVNHTYVLSASRYIINGDMSPDGHQNKALAWSMEISPAGGSTPLLASGPMNSNPTLHRHIDGTDNTNAAWQPSQYRFSFIVDPNCKTPMTGNSINLQTDLINRTSQNWGNDFYVDDIQLVEGPVVSDAEIPSICVLPPPRPAAVPTLGPWALSLLAGLLGFVGYRRRRSSAP